MAYIVISLIKCRCLGFCLLWSERNLFPYERTGGRGDSGGCGRRPATLNSIGLQLHIVNPPLMTRAIKFLTELDGSKIGWAKISCCARHSYRGRNNPPILQVISSIISHCSIKNNMFDTTIYYKNMQMRQKYVVETFVYCKEGKLKMASLILLDK